MSRLPNLTLGIEGGPDLAECAIAVEEEFLLTFSLGDGTKVAFTPHSAIPLGDPCVYGLRGRGEFKGRDAELEVKGYNPRSGKGTLEVYWL